MRLKHVIVIIIFLLLASAIFLVYSVNKAGQEVRQAGQTQTNSSPESTPNDPAVVDTPAVAEQSPEPSNGSTSAGALVAPMDRVNERVTKKPFGIYITKATSPVQPERFSGYHTAVDFETFAEEQNNDVSVKAVCAGKLLSKRTASGYGGVAVQSCTLDGQAVTVVYGHMRLSSIGKKVGDSLQAGEQLGALGTGFSSETDGERKHLHLGIHKGSTINIAGYVPNQASLANWLNILDYLH